MKIDMSPANMARLTAAADAKFRKIAARAVANNPELCAKLFGKPAPAKPAKPTPAPNPPIKPAASKPLAALQTQLAGLRATQAETRRAIASLPTSPAATATPAAKPVARPAGPISPTDWLAGLDAGIKDVHGNFALAPTLLAELAANAPAENTRGIVGLAELVRTVKAQAAQAAGSTATHAHLRGINRIAQVRASHCGAPSKPADPSGILKTYASLNGEDGLKFFREHRAEIEAARSGVILDTGEFANLSGTERTAAAFAATMNPRRP